MEFVHGKQWFRQKNRTDQHYATGLSSYLYPGFYFLSDMDKMVYFDIIHRGRINRSVPTDEG
jgi:hypothetical protein